MDFTTTAAASQFIKLVSTVCPCTTTDRVPRVNRGRPQTALTSAPSSRPLPAPEKTQKRAPTHLRRASGAQTHQTGPSSVISADSDDSHTLPSGSSDPLLEAFPVHNKLVQPQIPHQTFVPRMLSQNDVTHQQAIHGFFPPSQAVLPSTPVPSSSQMLPPTAPITPSPAALQPGTQPPNVRSDAFLESLMQSPTVYGLSKPQLEAVVAQVIREEGFVELVCVDVQR